MTTFEDATIVLDPLPMPQTKPQAPTCRHGPAAPVVPRSRLLASTVTVRVDAAASRLWLEHVTARLRAAGAAWVTLVRARDAVPVPGPLESLLSLERLIGKRNQPWWAEPLRPTDRPDLFDTPGDSDITLNLAGTPAPAGKGIWLDVTYDGTRGLLAAADAVLGGRTPAIVIRDGATGAVLAHGVASLEAAGSTGEALTAIVSRVVTLTERALAAPMTAEAIGYEASPPQASSIGAGRLACHATRSLAMRAAQLAYRLCFRTSHWRIGWRLDEAGVIARGDLSGPRWQVLADPGTHSYADPFPIEREGRRIVYFENLDHRIGKGIISRAEIFADGCVGPTIPVIEEPWHLSYPFLIEQEGALYMVPESSRAGDVAIYRCTAFPDRWERHATLLSGIEASDATIHRHEDGRFYLFAVVRNGIGGYSDTLAIFHSHDLFTGWRPHGLNPVLIDPSAARPAGAMVGSKGQLRRPVQDCRGGYGAALGLGTVTELSPDTFAQRIDTVVAPHARWPGRKLHTLNKWGQLEVVDGCIYRPKSGRFARLTDRRYDPAGA